MASIALGVFYQADPKINARLRFPISNGSIDGADATSSAARSFSATAVGNVEMGMTYNSDMGPHTKLPLDIGLFLPVASGDRFPPPEGDGRQRAYLVNTAAQWSRGFEEDALFAPHRLSLVPSLALRYSAGGISARAAFVKLPLLMRMGGGDPPSPSGRIRHQVRSSFAGHPRRRFPLRRLAQQDRHRDARLADVDVERIYRAHPRRLDPADARFSSPSNRKSALRSGQLKAVLGVVLPIGGRLAGGDLHHVYGFRLGAIYGF